MREKNPLKNFIYFYNLVCSKRQTESKRKQSIHLEQHIFNFFFFPGHLFSGYSSKQCCIAGVYNKIICFFFSTELINKCKLATAGSFYE